MVSRNYWWPGITIYIHKYVDGCDTCQRTKNFPKQPYGPLYPNEVPDGPWQTITMDFVTDLPESEGKDSILVVTNRHTKMIVLIPCTKDVDAQETAHLFERYVWPRFGTPRQTISDRGLQFASKFLQELFGKLNIKSQMSTANHPQTDGSSERAIQKVEQYLRAFSTYRKDDWMEYLHLAEFAYNNQRHDTIGISPFMALYGFQPNWEIPLNSNTKFPAVDD